MTTVTIREQTVVGIPWLVISGPRIEAFRALGEHASASIRAVQDALPERLGLRRYANSERGQATLKAVAAATEVSEPAALTDLRSLAEGAGQDFESILLANLRGDLGFSDGAGCTDVAWSRNAAFVGHNEDGAPALDGHFRFLTLALDDEIPVTTQWYPGFVPSNAWTINAKGLVWGINHIQVAYPAAAPGRHFVARGLQTAARDFASAVSYLRKKRTAGGYAYTIGELSSGRSITVESAAGRFASRTPESDSPLVWHTNHIRFLPKELDAHNGQSEQDATSQLGLYDESVERGATLDALQIPLHEPDVAWFSDFLVRHALPKGVHRTATGRDPLKTLCTTIVDLHNDVLNIQTPVGSVNVRASDFALGSLVPVV